ncbi:hypothetical protein SK128_011559 [Halocaridina rubra]|uniref:Haloacid dehalogenase-like hydrolase domain-containing protein 3 n=1 Tax=Halocaridina rubra TaxID=373956 RepID=A0AAN8XEQ4_HALRR
MCCHFIRFIRDNIRKILKENASCKYSRLFIGRSFRCVMLRLTTLDVTNTLLRFARAPEEQYAAIAQLYGLNPDPKKLGSAFRATFKHFEKEFPYYGASSIGWQNWWLSVVADTFRKSGCNADDATLRTVGCHLNKHYSQGSAYELVEGTVPLLKKLTNKSNKIGVISNSDERISGILCQLGLGHYFDFVLTSYSFSCSKPDPKIFTKALEAAGGEIQPSEALHIGDDVYRDYLGARACGWKSFLVTKNLHKECEKEGLKIDTLSMFTSLYELLEALND